MNNDVIYHYDKLIEEGNDPVNDPQPLKEYMDKWDGQVFIDKLQLSPVKFVLEIGVGTGRLAVKIAPLCRRFTGIDISPKTIERVKENLAEYDNVSLICDDFGDFNFDSTFDTIYSSLTFMHIENKQETINKIYGLLNPGGRFVLSIDKNQDKFIDFKTRKLRVYPDYPDDTKHRLELSGFAKIEMTEAEFGYVFSAERR